MTKYADLNTFFTTDRELKNPVLYDIEDIKQGLERLFSTGRGEVPFNREYGTSLKQLLFENALNPEDIKMFLYMDITDFEPRINLSPNDIKIEALDNNTYSISCQFTVPGLNNQASVASVTLTDK